MEENKEEISEEISNKAARGERVLGVAYMILTQEQAR